VVIDLIVICNLGTPTIFSAIAKVYPPTNFRVILTALGDGATLALNKKTSRRMISCGGLTSLHVDVL
jgi:hypothetical protein